MIRNIGVLATSLVMLTSAFSMDAVRSEAKQIIALQGGETLYVFEDGLMSKENKFGRPVYLSSGELVQTIDGQKIAVKGNEIARLTAFMNQGHRN
jgi:hypothetical protein